MTNVRSPNLAPQRILVRGVNWLGDAVMTTPALQRLREHFPQARICLLTPQKLAELWQQHPSIDEVLSFAPGTGPFTLGRQVRAWRSGAQPQKAGENDLAVLFPN